MEQYPTEKFASLDASGACRHAFIKRIPGIDVSDNKAEALKRLDKVHREIRNSIGMGDWPLLTAEQIHGNKIAIVDLPVAGDKEFAGCDGIITNQRKVALGIHVADCCAVYIVDRNTPAIGLVHSGKKGTELAVVSKAIQQMRERFGSNPADLTVQLSPCIRPPHYEIDFAAKIIEQCRGEGVKQIHDSGICTACHVDLYYSYRAEKGKTGRMLALLGLL
ncbi:MAG TPA: polyphenol oxidase family protein [Chthoniobacterales bacterium]|nr:polyphenol oxidase family protein [Chthoniobacterales bacterium]